MKILITLMDYALHLAIVGLVVFTAATIAYGLCEIGRMIWK